MSNALSNFISVRYYLPWLCSYTLHRDIKGKLQPLCSPALQINSDDNKQWEDCVLIPALFSFCMRLTLWALIYRWAGGRAEKDIHKMDQFPLGKGKSVCSIPTATASIVLSLTANTGTGVWGIENFPTSLLFCFQLCCSSMHHVTSLFFQKNTAELVMGLTVPVKTSHTLIPSCMPFSFSSHLSDLIACSKDLLWLQLLLSHYRIVQYIFFLLRATISNLHSLSQYGPI